GFDYMAANNCVHQYYNVSYYENETGPRKIDGWAPVEETSLALRFLDEHLLQDDGKPFALFVGWGPPHHPYDKYPGQFNIYDPAKVDVSPNVPSEMEVAARQEIADYYGNVTALDDQMGRIMKALDERGQMENTILCFTSDHGDHLRSHGFCRCGDKSVPVSQAASKATPFEESIHIPFILHWPQQVKGCQQTDVLFNSVDIMPTLLGLCGIDVPREVSGTDLSHIVFGKEGPVPDSVYLQILGEGWPGRGRWVGYWRGVRTDRWLYARWHENERGPYLFDLQNDPWELNNLYHDPHFASVRETLEARLQQWMSETHDPFGTGERDPDTGMLLLGQKRTVRT
ncbi:MAG: Sulfatase, family, partial [Paenibacillaceae bacterium]|nr:Sulfatase, family [Paenibacillaceae bacterium]